MRSSVSNCKSLEGQGKGLAQIYLRWTKLVRDTPTAFAKRVLLSCLGASKPAENPYETAGQETSYQSRSDPTTPESTGERLTHSLLIAGAHHNLPVCGVHADVVRVCWVREVPDPPLEAIPCILAAEDRLRGMGWLEGMGEAQSDAGQERE